MQETPSKMSRKRNMIIGASVILALILCFLGFNWYQNRSKSPFEVAVLQQPSLQIEYCRPYKKGRLIFGPAEENPLLPYGRYWRLGANKATKLVLETDVDFGSYVGLALLFHKS